MNLKSRMDPRHARRFLQALTALAVAGTIGASSASVASGQPAISSPSTTSLAMQGKGFDRCPDGAFCLFEHSDGTGKFVWFTRGGHKKLQDIGGGFNDMASAVWNRSPNIWCIYEHNGRGGASTPYYPWRPPAYYRGQIDNLSDEGGWWNERASSALLGYWHLVGRMKGAWC